MSNRPLQIELPHGEDDPVTLGLAIEVHVEPDTALWLLEDLTEFGYISAQFAETWPLIRLLAADVEARPRGWYLDIAVGAGDDRAIIQGSFFDAQNGHVLRMRCQRCSSMVCEHKLAAALALAAQDASWRGRLLESAWSRFLGPLAATAAAEAAADDRPGGWIRAELHDEPDGDSEIAGGRMSILLVPLSRRNNQPLKPRRAPRSLAATESKVRGLSDGDRTLLRLFEQHRLLDHINTYRYADSTRVSDEVARIERDIFAALADVTEVWFDDGPVTVDPRPWITALRVTDDRHGGLALRWTERPRAVFPVGDGYIVDEDNRLRPLDSRLSLDALPLIERTPPAVPARDLDAFVDRFVLETSLPVEINARRLPLQDGTPTPRLVLSDDGGTLRAEARFAYGPTEIDRNSPPVIRAPFTDRRVLIRRDRAAERAYRRRLRELLPDKPLRGETAYDFLHDALPKLDGWEIAADKSLDLRTLRPVGTLETQARLKSGIDWFDLDVGFAIGDQSVRRADVLKSWREGRRYIELGDGTIAKLPETWLEKHGATLEELDEMRGRRKKLGAHAAPVAAELLDELADDQGPDLEATLDRWRELAARIRTFDKVPERDTPPGLDATLRDYQHRGYRWMTALRDLGLGGVLADDMGLGKTIQTLTVLLETHQPKGRTRKGDPSLVVAPTSVVHNWLIEAAKFTPDLRIHLHHGQRRGEPPTDVDVVITSFALLRVDAELLCARRWTMVVLDEAQHIKNPASRLSQTARDLDAKHRLALTGTPLENHLIELWSIFEFLMPGFFGSRRAFTDRYVKPIQRDTDPEARAHALDHLRRRIRPFVLRRLKREVASELPPRQEQILYCDLGPTERRMYEAVKQTYRDTVLGQVDSAGLGRSTIQILEALTRLRQAACDAHLLPFPEARAVTQSAKRSLLRQTLAEAIDEGHRALVFSQWPSLLKRVVTDLDALAVDYLYLDGSTTERGDLQARWNDPNGPPVFLISLKAGGTGLNLIGADLVIHLDPWWNPQVEAQATDRAHRIGQTKPVMVYKLVARGTVEEKILELQARKRSLFEAAVDGDRVAVDNLTRADLEAVLSPDTAAVDAANEVGEREPDDSGDDFDDASEDASDDSADGADDSNGGIALADGSTNGTDDSSDDTDASNDDADEAPTPSPTELRPDVLPDPVVAHLVEHGELSNSDLRDLLDLSSAQAGRRLKQWTTAGLLRRTGRRYNTRYHLPT